MRHFFVPEKVFLGKEGNLVGLFQVAITLFRAPYVLVRVEPGDVVFHAGGFAVPQTEGHFQVSRFPVFKGAGHIVTYLAVGGIEDRRLIGGDLEHPGFSPDESRDEASRREIGSWGIPAEEQFKDGIPTGIEDIGRIGKVNF
jgi:hypothetical protein